MDRLGEEGKRRLIAMVRDGTVESVKHYIDNVLCPRETLTDPVVLNNALRYGNTQVARYLLSTASELDIKNSNSDDSLHLAVKLANKDIVELLLQKGACIDARSGSHEYTPLCYAVLHDNFDIIQLLLDHGAAADIGGDHGGTPLHIAVEKGRREVIYLLLNHGANVNAKTATYRTPLHVAVRRNDVDTAFLLFEKGALVNARTVDAFTPLHVAIENSHVDSTGWLLGVGADTNAVTAYAGTPLHIASKKGNIEIVQMLLDCGANVGVELHNSETPLKVAVGNSNKDVVELLLRYGASVQNSNPYSPSALCLAAEKASVEIVEMLLKEGAHVNIENSREDYSPLHKAVERGNAEIVEVLLKNGAKADVKMLNMAVEKKLDDIAASFLKSGVCVNDESCCNCSPLKTAIKNRLIDFVKLLIDYGANVNQERSYYDCPLSCAVKSGSKELVEILLDRGACVNTESNGSRLLIDAIESGSEEILVLLLERGTDVHQTLTSFRDCSVKNEFLSALKKTSRNIVERLLDRGADFACDEILEILIQKEWKDMVDVILDKEASSGKASSHWPRSFVAAFGKGRVDIIQSLLTVCADIKESISNELLCAVVQKGDKEMVQLLLDKGADVNRGTTFNSNPLCAALRKGDMEMVQLLLGSGASVNVEKGEYPLYIAVQNERKDFVELLLDKGADVNRGTTFNSNPLCAALQKGDMEMVQLLLGSGASVNVENSGPLLIAVSNDRKDFVKLLLGKGADPNGGTSSFSRPYPLCAAVRSGNREIVQLLLYSGAKVNVKVEYYSSFLPILYIAVEKGRKDIVELLLGKGADVNQGTTFDSNPLCAAFQKGDMEMVQLLLRSGANMNAVTCSDDLICTAVEQGHKDMVELLLNNGADVNLKSVRYRNPLRIAVNKGHFEMVKLLLSKGADVKGPSSYNTLPEYVYPKCMSSRYTDIVRLLLTHAMRFKEYSLYRRYLLRQAITNGGKEIVDLILKQGADISDTITDEPLQYSYNQLSGTALYHAVEKGCPAVVNVVLRHKPNLGNEENQAALDIALKGSGLDYTEISDTLMKYGYTIKPQHANLVILCVSIENGRTEIVEMLLKMSTNVGVLLKSTYQKHMPLHFAVLHKQKNLAKILIGHGADAMANDDDEKTATYYAVKNNDLDMVKVLLQEDNNYEGRMSESVDESADMKMMKNVLFEAVALGKLEILDYLVKSGADINVQDTKGRTALHQKIPCPTKIPVPVAKKLKRKETPQTVKVTNEKMTETVEFLLKKGAHVNARTIDGETPLHYAVQNGSEEIVGLLLNCSADVNAVDENGFSALHHSVRSKSVKMTKMLLTKGAFVDVRTVWNFAPLHIACEIGNAELVSLLLHHYRSKASLDHFSCTSSRELHNFMVNICTDKGRAPLHYVARNYTEIEIMSPGSFTDYSVDYYEVCNILLRKGANINVPGEEEGVTPLHIAVRKRNKKLVSLFLNRGANVNAATDIGRTPLHVACSVGNLDIVKLLLENNADVNAKDEKGIPPLYDVCTKNSHTYESIVYTLFDYGAVIDVECENAEIKPTNPLYFAVKNQNRNFVEHLLKKGAAVNAKSRQDVTALHIACKNGSADMVELLLKNGADVNAMDSKGEVPLYMVDSKEFQIYETIVKLLIDNGASLDFDFQNAGRKSKVNNPLCLAVEEQHRNFVEYLLENGANINVKSKQDVTALHIACKKGSADIVMLLLLNGADSNAKDANGETPLHCAVAHGNSYLIDLVTHAANVNMKSKLNATPLHKACKIADENSVKLLLQHSADVNAIDQKGETPLHIVCGISKQKSKAVNIIRILLEFGADSNITNFFGATPLDCAKASNLLDQNDSSKIHNTPAFFCILEHVIKMEAADFYVHPRNLHYLKPEIMAKYYDARSETFPHILTLKTECIQEISVLKSEKVDESDCSFYDVLTTGLGRLMKLAMKENVMQTVSSDDFKKKFPLYANFIIQNLENAKKNKN